MKEKCDVIIKSKDVFKRLKEVEALKIVTENRYGCHNCERSEIKKKKTDDFGRLLHSDVFASVSKFSLHLKGMEVEIMEGTL